MDLTGKLKQGMRVVGADQTEYGTVERYDDDTVYVGGRPVPSSAFERIDQDHLYVGQSGARYFSKSRQAQTMTQAGELRIPLVEERLDVSTRTIELGDVEIHKAVETEQVSVPIVLRRDQVAVHQIDVEERPIAIGERADAFTGDTIRVPVRGEEAIVSKEAVVTGEVAVARTQVSEHQTVSETVRQVTVDVTADYDEARAGFRQHFDRFQAQLQEAGGPSFSARDFTDAEPNYRAGFEARNDPRNANRSFEDVEPALRQEYLDNGANTVESWDTHRDEIRNGWEQGRR
jgi:uncharacterized protein (TIGR02271 family)